MFGVHFDDEELRRKLEAAERAVEAEMPAILNLIGVQVLSFVSLDYDTKSRGGTGTDGISWSPLAPSTIAKKSRRGRINEKRKTTKSGKARPGIGSTAIGVDTGLQRASAQPGFAANGGGNVFEVTTDSVTVGFNRSYSKYFDEDRPLLPNRLPPEWEKDISELMKRRLEKTIGEKLG